MPLARQRRDQHAPRVSRREIALVANDARTRVRDVEEFVADFYMKFNKLKKDFALLKRKYDLVCVKMKKMKPMKVMKAMNVLRSRRSGR